MLNTAPEFLVPSDAAHFKQEVFDWGIKTTTTTTRLSLGTRLMWLKSPQKRPGSKMKFQRSKKVLIDLLWEPRVPKGENKILIFLNSWWESFLILIWIEVMNKLRAKTKRKAQPASTAEALLVAESEPE